MKRRLAWILAAAMLLCLTACGKKAEEPEKGSEPTVGLLEVGLYSAGTFTAQVPEGWFAMAVSDIYDRPISSRLRLVKGDGDEMDYGDYPHMEISYFSPEFYPEHNKPDEFEDVEMLEDMTFGDKTFSGFTGRDNGQKIIHLWCEAEKTQFTVTIFVNGVDDSVTLEDADVQAILAGLKPL